MYYNIPEQNDLSFKEELVFKNKRIIIDLNDPDSRFKVIDRFNAKSQKRYARINDVANEFPENTRNKIKKSIFKKTKSLFKKFEVVYPDSSTGILSFLSGKDYRTPILEKFYNFDINYIPLPLDQPFPEFIKPCEYEYHKKHFSHLEWPFKINLKIKNKSNQENCISNLDPYMLIDLFFNNAMSDNYSYSFDCSDKTREYYFKPNRSVNRVDIASENGVIKISYENIQKQIVKLFNDFLNDLTTERNGIKKNISASYVNSYLNDKINTCRLVVGAEFNRISKDIWNYNPLYIGLQENTCIIIDLNYTFEKNPEWLLGENASKIRKYYLTKFMQRMDFSNRVDIQTFPRFYKDDPQFLYKFR